MDEKPTLSSIRTFKGDVSDTISREKLSLVGMALKEKERRAGGEEVPAAAKSKRNIAIIITSVVLVVAGIGIGVFILISKPQTKVATPQKQAQESILFADAQKELNVTSLRPETVISSLHKEMLGVGLKLGEVENIFFTSTTASTAQALAVGQFFNAVGADAPDALVRSLNDNYMYGIHIFDKNTAFLFLESNSYEKTYAEMLGWEKNYMFDRFAPALEINVPKEDLSVKPFEDAVIKNIDVRVLRDSAGNIALLYAFLNRNYLVITTNENTFYEVLSRFTTPKPVVR
jgi:hypothetical protein